MSTNLDTLKNLVEKQKCISVIKKTYPKEGVLINWSITVGLKDQFLARHLIKLRLKGEIDNDKFNQHLVSIDFDGNTAVTDIGKYELGDPSSKFIRHLQDDSMSDLEDTIKNLKGDTDEE